MAYGRMVSSHLVLALARCPGASVLFLDFEGGRRVEPRLKLGEFMATMPQHILDKSGHQTLDLLYADDLPPVPRLPARSTPPPRRRR